MDSTENVETKTIDELLSVNQHNQLNYENKSKELGNTQHIELIGEDCQNLFENNEEWKSSVQKSLNEIETKIKSKEDDIQLKYEKVLEMKDSLVQQKKELKSKIEDFEEEKKQMQKRHEIQDNKIALDIGGQICSTSKSTLCAKKDSLLGTMFSGRHELVKSENGAYFIDADGTYFGIILNYLRGRIQYISDLPDNRNVLLQLRKEAHFCNLVELKDLINICLNKYNSEVENWRKDCIKPTFLDNYKTTKVMHLGRCDFSNCSFMNITFVHEAYFEHANFREATFSECTFYKNVSFKNSELVKTQFSNCKIQKGVLIYFDEANLDQCSFGEINDSFSKLSVAVPDGEANLKKGSSIDNIFSPSKPPKVISANQFQFASMKVNPKRGTYSLESYIETMSFHNARNIEKVHFPNGKLEIILRGKRVDNGD